MPPDDAERKPGDDECKVLEQWIGAGAEFSKATGRTPAFVAVTLSIGSLNLFAFRDDKNDKSQHVIIPARSAGESPSSPGETW